MNSFNIFIFIVFMITLVFLLINFLLAPHNPYKEKYSIFECGFHSFFGQNRIQFTITFFIFALLFLILDLEILLLTPFSVSQYINNIYGLFILIIFAIIIGIGFIYEIGKGALKIYSKQSSLRVNLKKKIQYIPNKYLLNIK
jgi:NADH-ubiquinone oxidoreductase chain 3